jgi:hypothetical protein
VGERKECGGGVWCDRCGVGAAVRWSKSEEGDDNGAMTRRSEPRFLSPAGRVHLFRNRPWPVASISSDAGWSLGVGAAGAGNNYELVSVEGRPACSMPRGLGLWIRWHER